MPRTVIAGIDGSAEARAAALWAAREAERRKLPLKVLHVWQPWTPAAAYASLHIAAVSDTTGDEERWADRLLRETEEELQALYPSLDLSFERIPGNPIETLGAAADEAEILVLGSRALGTVTGFLTGSISMAVLAHAKRPVVLVRPQEPSAEKGEQSGEERGDVVLGLDLARPCDPLIEYAVDAAAVRSAALRVVHVWTPPPLYGYDPAAVDPQHIADLGHRAEERLQEGLRPWRARFPQLRVESQCFADRPAPRLTEAAEGASLLVVGRRARSRVGVVHIGPVTHAVLHHARTPVVVVPHE
ncbi:universal stress protein [Streptomyces sp. NBC_00648]|uniref:universal stress protein n=1 Tax=Streptomyces sp. NBC_00648 TaxID=2975797 RepID=UPI00324C7AA9